MTGLELLGLLAAGIGAGLVGTIASLASLVSYPALLALGLSPVSANVTNTVALMFSAVGAVSASRPELAGQGRRVLRLGAVTAVGGAAGAALLLLTPPQGFEYAAPLLIAAGSIIIMRPPGRPAEVAAVPVPGSDVAAPPIGSDAAPAGLGALAGSAEPVGQVRARPEASLAVADAAPAGSAASAPPVALVPPVAATLADGELAPATVGVPLVETAPSSAARVGAAAGGGAGAAEAPGQAGQRGWVAWGSLVVAAVYIGYFGAAGGILLLAVLIRMLAQPLAKVNAVKNAVAGLANAVAGLGFAIFGPVRWTAVVPLAAGFLIGGWTGPKLVRRLPARGLRIFVGCCGLAAAVKLGASAYL
jgi:hypothetical protein